jgi:hypothetical protein
MAKIYQFRQQKKKLLRKEKGPPPLGKRVRNILKKLARMIFGHPPEKKIQNFHSRF